MKNALGSVAILLVTGLAAFTAAQGCSSDKSNNGFGEQTDAGNTDVYVPPPVGTDQPDSGEIVGEGCGGGEVLPQKVPVYFEFVVDGSGSMSGAKWDGQVAALKAIFEDQKNKTAAQISNGEMVDTVMGVLVFEDRLNNVYNSGPFPKPGVDIPPQPIANNDDLAMFWGRVSGQASGGTPTLNAITGGYSVIEGYVPQANVKVGGKRVVILLSDGEPNGGSSEESQCVSLATTKTTGAKPVYTYAIGVGNGSSYNPGFMAKLAQGGKTAPAGCNPALTSNPDCFYQIDPGSKSSTQITNEMVAALNSIRALASQCDLSLTLVDKDGKPADPKKVQVTYIDGNGKEVVIEKDPVNGWTYDDDTNPTRIILNGNACVQARSDEKGKTKVKMGCKVGGG